MNILMFQFPRGAGTIGVRVPVRAGGLRKVQQLFEDTTLQEPEFSLVGLTIRMRLTSGALANHFDLESDARFECLLNLKTVSSPEDHNRFQITATVFEVGYDANAVTSLPLLCDLTPDGEVLSHLI